MPKVSVIIPVYNVEAYLKQCLDSVINQTLKDIEIILVDDESPDNCPKICDDYAKKDKRIKVIHQKNRGLGGARNAGLDVALGEYVLFLDSDDWISEDCCEQMYRVALKFGTEIVLSGETLYFENENKYSQGYRKYSEHYSEEITHKNYISCFTPAWGRLYNRKFIEDNQLRFVEKCFYEDNSWGCLIAALAHKVSYAGNFFFYRQRAGSITNKIDEKIMDWNRDFEYFKEQLKRLTISKNMINYAYEWYLLNFFNYLHKCPPNLIKNFMTLIYDSFKDIELKKDDFNKQAIFMNNHHNLYMFFKRIKKGSFLKEEKSILLFGFLPLYTITKKYLIHKNKHISSHSTSNT